MPQTSPEKDRVTTVHQWLTIVGVPLILGVLSWFAVSFNALQITVAQVGERVAGSSAVIANHEQRIQTLEHTVYSDRRP